jgi:Sigma-70, region 4
LFKWTSPIGPPIQNNLYSRSEFHGILRKALEGLAPALRVVFILQDLEGLSIKETAAVLDLNSNAVKARLHRARLQLREKLSKYFRKPIASGANSQRLFDEFLFCGALSLAPVGTAGMGS